MKKLKHMQVSDEGNNVLKNRICKIIGTLLIVMFGTFGHAQNIAKFEYFIDTDPGAGLATAVNVTPTTQVTDLNIPIATTSLAPGFHTLYIRSQNVSGQWTHTHYRTFFIDNSTAFPTIGSFNPSSGLVGSSVTITGTNFSATPANNTVRFNGVVATVTASSTTSITATVPAGATTGAITVQVAGLTATSSSSFNILLPNLTAAEYFFNNDPGPGNGTAITITTGTTIDITNLNIPTTSLAEGTWNTLCVRVRDANNVWGFYECRRIYIREDVDIDPIIPPSPITQMEFYYDTDPGPGAGTPISITSGTDVDLVNTNLASTLPIGWHTVSVRVKNDLNVWGFPETRRIYVREPAEPCCEPPSPIVALEWFVDSDPGVGLSTLTKTINPAVPDLLDLVDEPLNIGTIPLGARKIGLRAKNQAGEWSMTELRDFTVTPPCTIITPPTAPNQTRCDNGTLTLTASGAITGQTYRWYADNTTLTALFEGNPFVTPALAANTNYFVTVFDPVTFCESTRTQVTAIVTGIPKQVLNLTGSLAVCEGNTVSLIAPAGFTTYTWRNGVADLGLNTNQITVNVSGTYTLTVSNDICTSPPSDVFTFTINTRPAKPTVTGTGGGSLCSTGSVTLSAPVGFAGYSWSDGQTTQQITVATIGNYTVRVTDASGCQSDPSDPYTVITSPPEKPIISVTGNTTLCGSNSVLLTAPAGFTEYLWNNSATTQSITVSTAASYTVTVKQGSCSSPISDAVDVTTVTVPGKPSVAALNSTNLCIGAFVVLQAPINNFYLWNNGETSRQIVATTAGTYTVQVGNAANCLSVASDGLVVTETGLPCTGASGPTVANVNRCGPGSITITASGATGGQVYRWYDAPTGGTLLNTGNPYSPTIAATTPFYVSIFDPGNSTETNRSAVTATVVSIITPTINPGNVSICEGSTTLLSGPTGFVQYLWSNNATTQQIPVSDNGTFTLQAGDGTCLSASSAPVTVTKVPAIAKPVITAVGSTALCGSSSVTLRAPTGFSSYTWSTGSTLAEITVSSAGNYTVVVGNGTCTSPTSDAINVTAVTIPSQPTIAVTGSTALCNGAFVVLTAPASFSNYVWNNGETTRQIVVTVAGSYFVQTGNSATCLSVVSASVVVTETGQSCGGAATPEANFIASIVCQGQATSFSDLSINLGNNPTYAWDFDGDGSTESTTVGNVTYIYSSYGSYNATLKITLEGGSIITRTRTVDVNAVPVVAFTSNTLCLGAATVFTDNSTNVLASATYSWDFNNDGSEDSAVKGNTSFAYAAAGNYSASLRIDNQNGCSTQRIFPVTVNRAPLTQLVEIDGGASPQLCSGVSILLKVTPEAGVTYQWKRNTVNVGTNQPEFTVNTSGTYSVTLTNTCGTINAINTITTVTVPTPLAATITTTGSTSLCAGESLLLSVPFSSGIQYQWKRDNSLITDATATVLLATEGGSYTLVSENSCGSVESVPFIVTGLAAAPSIPTIGYTGNLTLCSPEQVELHIPAVSNVTYTWRRNGIDLSLNQNSIMVDQAGVYTLQLSNACRTVLSSNSLQVIVNQKPLAQLISANRAPIICPGEVVLLAVTPELGVTYQWQLNNNPVGSNAAQVSATDAGTYRLKLTNTCGEIFSSNTIALNVIATPSAPVITAGSETTICENQTVALTIPALAGVSYSWLKDNSPINFTNSNTFIASQAGTYTVKVNNGCTEVSGANSIAVTLLPRAPLTQSIQIVSGASVFCTPGQVELGVAQEVGVSYQWLVNGIATGTNKNTLITSAAGVYTVQMFNDCRTVQSINSVTVSVLDKPLQQNIQASRSTDLCLGESVQLSVPLEASVSYQWIRNGIVLTGEISSTTAAVDAGEYQVKMSNGCGDRLSDIRLVTVLSTPASASIEPKSSLNFCQGGNVILSVPFVAGQTYQWKKDGLNFATTFEVLAQESGSYTVEIGNRCYSNSSIIPVTVTEFSNPEQPIIDAFLEDECDKRTYELTARGTFVSYQWFIGTSRLVSTNSATYFPVATGVYKVRGTDSNGCSSDSEPYNVDISSPRTPIIISQGDPDSLLTTDVVADKFQWYVNNKFIVGANQRQINVFYNGEYKVRVTYEDGCRVFSTGYSLNEEGYNKYGRFATFPSDTSIVLPERKFDDLIEVTPNPTKGMVKVTYFGSPTEGTVCAVYNQLGVAIRQGTMVKRFGYLQLEFDLSDMEGGLYLIKLSSPFSSITQRIIKL